MKTIRNIVHTALVLFAFACFAVLQTARAVVPAPDGGYANANTAEGTDALLRLTTGRDNTAIGFQALWNNTVGNDNTAVGYQALWSNTEASSNTAIGMFALINNTLGNENTAVGTFALLNNVEGEINTAIGVSALESNGQGMRNTAIGYRALQNTSPTSRIGYNTATGAFALLNNTTGDSNTANGDSALFRNTSGIDNTGIGQGALYSNTTGRNNTAIGSGALANVNNLLTTGSNNIALGYLAGSGLTNGSNNIDIGNAGVAGEAGAIRIGVQGTQTKTIVAGIYNVSEGGTIKPVYINSNGRLGTQPPPSARKFKEQIKTMEKTSEAILKLNPVSFRYKNDEERTPQFGLIAEEVAKVNPDLILRDEEGEIYTVRYEAVNAMLLNEFLKEHQKVQRLEAALAAMDERLKEQDAKIDRVNDKVELSKPAPQTVLNNR